MKERKEEKKRKIVSEKEITKTLLCRPSCAFRIMIMISFSLERER